MHHVFVSPCHDLSNLTRSRYARKHDTSKSTSHPSQISAIPDLLIPCPPSPINRTAISIRSQKVVELLDPVQNMSSNRFWVLHSVDEKGKEHGGCVAESGWLGRFMGLLGRACEGNSSDWAACAPCVECSMSGILGGFLFGCCLALDYFRV